MKKITIGLVTYNRPELLKRAVKSILNQSFKNYILLIGNDYVDSKITFKSLGVKKNNKIKIFNHKTNLGERNNLNFLLNKSKTEWFCWLGDDDYLHKDFFKILINGAKKFNKQKIVACYSNYSRKHLKNDKKKKDFKIYNKNEFLLGFTSKRIRLIGTFGLLKTKYLKKINGINKTGLSFKQDNIQTGHYPYCDPLIPIMMSNFGKIIWLDEKLVFLNTDINSISPITDDYEVYKSAEDYVLKNLKKNIKNIKYKSDKFEIICNILKWFLFTRSEVIKRRNFFKNLFLLINLIFDCILLYNLFPERDYKLFFFIQKKMLKAIFQSTKKIF